MEQEIEAKSTQLASELRSLGRRIAGGDESELLVWVVSKALACAHRPLRYNRAFGGSVRNLDRAATPLVIEWADLIQASDVRSIICLMHETELRFYDALDLGSNGLVGFYRDRGFNVEHIPWEDPAHSKSSSSVIQAKRDEVRQAALEAYDALPNPVLIHCSAGEQRSAPVAAFIWWHVGRRGLTTG